MQLILRQKAEKDVKFNFDTDVVFQVNDGSLVMTTTVFTNEGPISGTRHFSQGGSDILTDLTRKCSRRSASPSVPSRRTSIASSTNHARRGSKNASSHPLLRRRSADILTEESLGISPELANSPLFQKNRSPERQNHVDHGRPSIEISHH